MAGPVPYRRRVGTVRPSHLIFTAGVGALIDLPNFSVLVRGTDDWRYDTLPEGVHPLLEPRLLKAVSALLHSTVTELRPAPWMDGLDRDPSGQASRVGVPTFPFPQWLRCTACNELGPLDSGGWEFQNDKPRKPDEAKFTHRMCPRNKRKPLAVMARFVLACTNGHLDDFPYVQFVHGGGNCPDVPSPRLRMIDFGGNLGANVKLECISCRANRNIRQAMGVRGELNLPACRGRHPHLAMFSPEACEARPKVIVVGASNQWFAQTLSALVVPQPGESMLESRVEQLWEYLTNVTSAGILDALWTLPQFQPLHQWSKEDVLAAIQRRHQASDSPPDQPTKSYPDLRTPEWQIFSAPRAPEPTDDFTLRRDPAGVPTELSAAFADVIQVERLREVRALVGFTRLDAPDPDDPDLVVRAPLARERRPTWVPASEVRGEGIFLRLREALVAEWQSRVEHSSAMHEHREAFGRFREHRKSDRLRGEFDRMGGWPAERYIALHTMSHLLIRTIALECGYNSASLSELIYAGPDRAGILIYTAVPDAEGTLGGLVSLAEPERLVPLVRRALSDALRCSSDPLCAERLPHYPADFLHGAACHACLFISETSCERGNRFLDRRFVVPVDDPKLALLPNLL